MYERAVVKRREGSGCYVCPVGNLPGSIGNVRAGGGGGGGGERSLLSWENGRLNPDVDPAI